ncbi:hypothetical protein [Alkaliphilus metalliredigens]|nr:hypothetical protein [Alkaliphilus metalliredigens]
MLTANQVLSPLMGPCISKNHFVANAIRRDGFFMFMYRQAT